MYIWEQLVWKCLLHDPGCTNDTNNVASSFCHILVVNPVDCNTTDWLGERMYDSVQMHDIRLVKDIL